MYVCMQNVFIHMHTVCSATKEKSEDASNRRVVWVTKTEERMPNNTFGTKLHEKMPNRAVNFIANKSYYVPVKKGESQ